MKQQRGSPTMNANLRLWIILWTAATVDILCPTSACGQLDLSPAASKPSVEDFLAKNQLSRLLLAYRETQASNAISGRVAATEQLQRTYAIELFKPIADPAWAEQLLVRAKMSLAANPIRQSKRLRLAVAHREVEHMRLALLNGDRVAQADRIVNDLNSIQRGVKLQVDDLERLCELQQSSLGDEVRLQEQQQLRGHGEYLLGWSYFLKSASNQHQDKQVLRDAESSFRSYLDLPPYLNLTKFSEEKFGKENRYQRSAVVGLAVVMQAIGATTQSEHCFAIAEAHAQSVKSSNREIKNIVRWRFISFMNQGDFSAAKTLLLANPERLKDTVMLNAILNRTDSDAELTSLALLELALRFQPDQLRQSIERSPKVLANLADLRFWIRGYLAWDDYQKKGKPQMLQLAAETLQTAEKNFGEEIRPTIRGHCLFLLASCRLEYKNYSTATKDFLAATKLLANAEPDLAAEAAYRAFQATQMLPDDRRQHSKKISLELIENFPQSRFARLVEFELTLDRLKKESNLDAMQYLARYRTGETGRTSDRPDLVVSAATVEMARRYESSAKNAVLSFRDFMKTIKNDSRINTHAKIESNYHYLNALLAQTNSAELRSEFESVLTELQSLLDHPDSAKGKQQKKARFIYYQTLVLSRLQPDAQTEAFSYFQQLQSLNDSSPWTLAATTEVARFFEDVVDSRFANEPVLRQKMIDVYQALQTITASTTSTNRDAVEIKLTKLYLAAGKIEAANDLAANAPENPSWLPTLAALANAKGDYPRSELLWQRLEQLLPTGSSDWWEARLNRLNVLHQVDVAKAKAMLASTISLFPEAPQRISVKLKELGKQWGAQ